MRNSKLRGNTRTSCSYSYAIFIVSRAFLSCFYLTNRQHFAVVCSVIDTRYDIISRKTKNWPTSRLQASGSLMFLPHYDVYRVSITEQTTAKCYLFVLYNKNEKTTNTPFDVIMIYTKQSTPLAVDNSKISVIGLSLKWRQRTSVH